MINLPNDLTDFACVLADIARENITPLFRSNISIDTKSDKSPVTLADREAEGAMRRLINRQY
ncbi:MAG: histidinol phosphate phosphatase, partial [Pseudomonadota bacterium]|nr:histidinol phosphate phosphatase [Pseudomonadota bacterium]